MKVRPWTYTLPVLSVCFLILGFISIVGIIGHWHFGQDIPWLFAAYAAMNLLLGVGFWKRERWVLTAVGLNWAAYTTLYFGLWVWGGDVNLMRVTVSTAVAGGIWGLVYLHRRYLVDTRLQIVGAAFFIIWIFVYSLTLFTSIVL
ncbi:hypothetical protein HYS79_00195 [Patescibacteria group bacterium]|nr:hypothetical protein [Patescibacteria group bacterium]